MLYAPAVGYHLVAACRIELGRTVDRGPYFVSMQRPGTDDEV